MTDIRKVYKNKSNNEMNNNKNICVLAVAEALGVDKETRYLHTMTDIVRAARNKYTVRSRKSTLKGETIGQLRKSIISKGDAICYIVRVPNHCMLLNSKGETVVDTDPRKRDKRKISHIYGVYR